MTAVLEDIKSIEITDWKTLNTAMAPTKLPLGETPNAQNVWVDEKPGSVITANGFIKVGTLPSGNPCTFCINYFKTASGTQTFVCSDNATVWTTVDFQNFTSIITGLSSSFQLRGAVIRDKLWLINGSDSVRTYDGATVTVLDGTGGTPNVSKGRYIAYHDERVWIYHASATRSKVFFSALTDTSGTIIDPDNANAWPSSNNLQISEGDADFGTGMVLYRGYLYFFKQYTIWRLVGYDEYTYTRVKTRASTGTRFNESLQILDNLVHFIGTDGLYVFDGEDTSRISDLIDPATAIQESFGFNQLQQPNANNNFYELTTTTDWNTGTVPTDLSVDNQLALLAADDSQANFVAGATLTNVTTDENPGVIGLTASSSGVSSTNVALNKTATLTAIGGSGLIGTASFITDGNLSNTAGVTTPNPHGTLAITLTSTLNFTTIVLKSFRSQGGQSTISFTKNGGTHLSVVSVSPSSGGGMSFLATGGNIQVTGGAGSPTTPTDLTVTFASFTASSIESTFLNDGTGSSPLVTVTEIQILTAAYNTSGKFTSKTLDLGATPNSLGYFNATVSTPSGTSLTYFTQSSADGSSWDAEVACTNSGAIASTVRRYLRWGSNFVSDGSATPVISAAYLMAQFLSPIHDTGGSIFAWGPFESERSYAGQTINFYYRTGTTSPNCSAAVWNLIVPGGVINSATAQQFVQFKIEILGGTATQLPTVTSVTINWVKGSATQVATLQNVASFFWRNRYWLAAASAGATANDTLIVRGKKTFGSPWQLKDWGLLSFCRFQDAFYGGSSTDGSIYQLDTGYSKNGSAMDSFFETGDFVFNGFTANFLELIVEVERTGPYSLNVGYSIDRGSSWTEKTVNLTVSTFAPSYIKRLNINVTTDRIRFRVRINGTDQPFQAHRLIAYYKLEAERGSIQ